MALTLHTIFPKKGSRKTSKRLGRGLGSGKGTYSGRGVKGQKARSGGGNGLKKRGMRGIILAQPKARGFKSNRPTPAVVNVAVLNKHFVDGAKVNPKILQKKGLVEDISAGVKILASGELSLKLTVEECLLSAAAKEKIEKAGGKVV